MKILVIGCGSIGKRHIGNLLKLKAGDVMAFDKDAERLREVPQISKKVKLFFKLDAAWKDNPDVVFICTPTSLHMKYALISAEKKCHLFIEKPLSHDLDGSDRLLKIVERNNLISLVGCNMRFHWAIAKIKEILDSNILGRIISARIEAGKYLPDWHPWSDYRKGYSAKKRSGGGVLLDSIHEIDYALWFFGGGIKDITSMYGRLSGLEIETEDTVEMLINCTDRILVNIHLDYIQRPSARSCKIIGEKGTIIWQAQDRCVKLYLKAAKKHRVSREPENYSSNRMYIDELRYFFNCVRRKTRTFNDVDNGCRVLKAALSAKKRGINV